MAKKTSGEIAVTVGEKTYDLRLEIGTLIALEDYLGMGLLSYVNSGLKKFALKETTIFFMALTGQDYRDEKAFDQVSQAVWQSQQITEIGSAVLKVIMRSYYPNYEAKKPENKPDNKPEKKS